MIAVVGVCEVLVVAGGEEEAVKATTAAAPATESENKGEQRKGLLKGQKQQKQQQISIDHNTEYLAQHCTQKYVVPQQRGSMSLQAHREER